MSDFAKTLAAQRRLFILRRLVELGGQANETVLLSVLRQGGFSLTARADIRGDLDHLEAHGLADIEHLDALRIAKLRERGEDVAFGRVTVDGVEHELWRK